MKSETSKSKDILAPYCTGIGMDVGYGGEKVVPTAWAFDLPNPYTCVGEERQQLRGDCRKFPFLCDYALDYIYSSHVLEDFTYGELEDIIFFGSKSYTWYLYSNSRGWRDIIWLQYRKQW